MGNGNGALAGLPELGKLPSNPSWGTERIRYARASADACLPTPHGEREHVGVNPRKPNSMPFQPLMGNGNKDGREWLAGYALFQPLMGNGNSASGR